MEKLANIYQPTFKVEELRKAIQAEYKEVACNKDHTIHFTSGRKLAQRLQYNEEIMKMMPEEAIRPFAGVGNPFSIGVPSNREVVLDIGSGAGFDCIYGSLISGNSAHYIGVDMTDEMRMQAQQNAEKTGLSNIDFIKGYAEELPIESNSIDLVISNGVINLCPDKLQVYSEIKRVLKNGGRFMIADVLLERPVPDVSKDLIHLWTNCVAGATTIDEYLKIIASSGFVNVEIKNDYDVFQDARIAKSATYFGAKGWNIMGYKND